MKMKVASILLLTIIIVGLMLVMPVLAIGPTKSKGGNVDNIDPPNDVEWWCIFSKNGWRQWADRDGDGVVDRFAIVLYTEGMNPKALQAKTTKGGWSGPTTIGPSDARYDYMTSYEIIWKWHDIPAEG